MDRSFREHIVESKIQRKNFFDFVKKPPTLANAFRKKVFSRNVHEYEELLSTHYSQFA